MMMLKGHFHPQLSITVRAWCDQWSGFMGQVEEVQEQCALIICPGIFMDKPHIEGPSQRGPGAHGRAQSSLSLRKRQRGNSLCWMLQRWEAFSSACFSVSTGCVNYRARGCTLSSQRSCKLLRKSRASDSHDTDRNHTQIHAARAHARTHTRARASERVSERASGTSLPAARLHSCLPCQQLELTGSSGRGWHRGPEPLWRHHPPPLCRSGRSPERMWSLLPPLTPRTNFCL